jgi:AAA domain
MTQRERPTSDSATTLASGSPLPRSSPPGRPATLYSLWVEWYNRASEPQREKTLTLANTQGYLLVEQLPEFPVISRSLETAARLPAPGDLLNGSPPSPVLPQAFELSDTELDPVQAQAVFRAVNTPDVALIQGLPGTGRSRVLAEVVRQAVARGQRVLILAQHSAAVDRVLAAVANCPKAWILRLTGSDELIEALPPALHSYTAHAAVRALSERALPAARSAARTARALCSSRQADEENWSRFRQLAAAHDDLIRHRRELEQTLDAVTAAVEAELSTDSPTPLREKWLTSLRERDQALESVIALECERHAKKETLEGERRELQSEREQFAEMEDAGRRWWSAAWWGTLFRGAKRQRLNEIKRRLAEVESALLGLQKENERAETQRRQAETDCSERQLSLREEETRSRRAELEQKLSSLLAQQQELEKAWRETAAHLSAGTAAPSGASLEAVRIGHEAWLATLTQELRHAERAEREADDLERTLPALPSRLVRWTNVVGAPLELLRDSLLKESENPQFDLLIVDDAHLIEPDDLAAAARRARRWVLSGDAPEPSASRPGGSGRRSGSMHRPGLFQQLWARLHGDPSGLPVRWTERDGQTVCVLRPVSAELEGYVESERLADRPEIELRIVSPPRRDPHLAEVIFPASMSMEEAKAFIYHELQELTVEPAGSAACWREAPERLTLEFACISGNCPTVQIPLETGVQEVVASGPLTEGGAIYPTLAIHFDRSAGWTRQRAERWVADHLRLRDRGRTSLLTTPYRASPALARCLGEVLFPGAGWFRSCSDSVPDLGHPVEFVAVPSLAEHSDSEGRSWTNGNAAASLPSNPQRGAGLETSLAEGRRVDGVPDELRAALPAVGIVNHTEALAVVQALEELVSDTCFRSACATLLGSTLPVAVMALFPAQVELIRGLAGRVPALIAAREYFEVGCPESFLHRDCLVGMLSLTRSHTHRAVPFCETPRTLTQALTRASARLLVFGDAGTVSRRLEWHGPLDHLSEPLAQREHALLAHLLGHMPERLPETDHAARLSESSRA